MHRHEPLVSCLMVTRDRTDLARRSVECLARQTYENLELIVIDDGAACYEAMLDRYAHRFPIVYRKLRNDGTKRLGALRNLSLDEARGAYCIQWDDDEWSHPDRIRIQMDELLANRLHAVVLRETLMHIDHPDYVHHPFRTGLRWGTPGTVLHRRSSVRYPNTPKSEDSAFLRRLFVEGLGRVRALGPDASHLFIRCFHGTNTWDLEHFTERLAKGPVNYLGSLYARYVRKDPLAHPLFQLTRDERQSVAEFLAINRELGTLRHLARPAGPPREVAAE